MKVNINVTIELDETDWYNVFGKGHTRREIAKEVREDVIQYIYGQNECRGIPVTLTRNK